MGRILSSMRRVLLTATRPTSEQFKENLKAVVMIILLVGVTGFVFMAIGHLLTG